MKLDLDEIFTLIDKVEEVRLDSFEYQDRDMKVKIHGRKSPVVEMTEEISGEELTFTSGKGEKQKGISSQKAHTERKTSKREEETHFVKSPMVGTFYQAPGEGEAPFVSVGDKVKKGQAVGIIEAMKLMNEITADRDGVVKEILVENGSLVEFDQPIIRIELAE